VSRETQNVLLILVGGALLTIALNGTFLRYVKPSQQPWLIASGALMVLLALVAIGRDIRGAGTAEAEPHDHSHGRARSSWLLLLPVLTIFLIAPPALGSDVVSRSSASPVVAGSPRHDQIVKTVFPPLPAGTPLEMRMADVATRAAWDATNSLDGRLISVTGFAAHDRGTVYLARLVISCCAADAVPVKVRLADPNSADLPDDQWFTMTGQIEPGSATPSNGYVPTFAVSSRHPVQAPADPYEY